MATTENDIRTAVVLLLNKYGSLTTSEVKALLDTVMPFDDDDLKLSQTRNEPLILQRIGNVVSHQSENIKSYCNQLYQIDKSEKPARWTLLTGISTNNTIKPLSKTEIESKKQTKQFKPKKIDWSQIAEKRTELGISGEQFALRYETQRVMQFAANDTDRIIHLSAEQGDGAGFDILSLNNDGTQRYIEVKTTESGADTPFYMTENEKWFFETQKGKGTAFIYRIYNFDLTTKKGDIDIISVDDLFSKYNFDPISYKVIPK